MIAAVQEGLRLTDRSIYMASDTLIVYYSWSGNSEKLAKNLNEAIFSSDIFKIRTKRKYSTSFFVAAFQAGREKRKKTRPEIIETVSGKKLSKYERIILIYPIWDGSCPMAVLTFLESIKTEGLDIFPISTSSSVTLGSSLRDIRGSAPEANIAEGLAVPGKVADTQKAVNTVFHYLGLR